MDTSKDMLLRAEGGQNGRTGSNLSEATGDPMREHTDKPIQQNSLSPGPVPYSRNLDEAIKGQRIAKCGDMALDSKRSAPDRELSDIPNKDSSSSDAESDLYEEIDVSCTPESMDYPSGQGKQNVDFIIVYFLLIRINALIKTIKPCVRLSSPIILLQDFELIHYNATVWCMRPVI